MENEAKKEIAEKLSHEVKEMYNTKNCKWDDFFWSHKCTFNSMMEIVASVYGKEKAQKIENRAMELVYHTKPLGGSVQAQIDTVHKVGNDATVAFLEILRS